MNKKVCIRIKGLHSSDPTEQDDSIEVIYIGTYYKRNGKHYVKYEEPEESDRKPVSTIIKVGDNELEVMSMGNEGTHMLFSNGQKNLSYYSTPFGGINVGLETYDMNIDEKENLIVVDIKYGLEINLEFVSDCNVHIEIESIEE